MTTEPETLILVDLSSIFWTNWHATKDLELNETFDRTIEKVRSLADRGRVIVCVDSPPYKRKEIDPNYKAQRDKPEPNAIEQLKRVQQRISDDGINVIGAKGYEADDVIATLCMHATENAKVTGFVVGGVAIVSADKDLCQLADGDVAIWHAMRDETITAETIVQKYGVHPGDFVEFLALVGDKSDNVPGCPGVGPKTAAKLLGEHGTAEAVIGYCEDVDREARSSVEQKIVDNADAIRLSLKLVTLATDAPIDLAAAFAKREPKPLVDTSELDGIDDAGDLDDDDGVPITNHREPGLGAGGIALVPGGTITGDGATLTRRDDEPKAEPDAAPTALAKAAPVAVERRADWSLALEPRTIGAALKLARGLHESRLYSKFANAQAIWAVIIRGRELGLGALTSLDAFHVIEGKPCMHANLIVGLAKASPRCASWRVVESTDDRCTIETLRRGESEPERETYTIADADRADLTRPSRSGKPTQWQKDPRIMLTHRCGTRLARRVYPDVVGALYSPEELRDGDVIDAEFEHPELKPVGVA